MSDFRYCHCTTPDYFESGKLRHCRHCWLQEAPPPEPETAAVTRAWILHSDKMRMAIDRISRDLRVSPEYVRYVLGGG